MSLIGRTGRCSSCGHDHGDGYGSPRERKLETHITELQARIVELETQLSAPQWAPCLYCKDGTEPCNNKCNSQPFAAVVAQESDIKNRRIVDMEKVVTAPQTWPEGWKLIPIESKPVAAQEMVIIGYALQKPDGKIQSLNWTKDMAKRMRDYFLMIYEDCTIVPIYAAEFPSLMGQLESTTVGYQEVKIGNRAARRKKRE